MFNLADDPDPRVPVFRRLPLTATLQHSLAATGSGRKPPERAQEIQPVEEQPRKRAPKKRAAG